MPFDFLKRGKPVEAEPAPEPAPPPPAEPPGIAFDGLTEEWHLVGRMEVDGRLSDLLNHREVIPITSVSWAPLDGSASLEAVPGLKTIDPYDLIIVLAGLDSLPVQDDDMRAAHRIHKVSYDVALELPPFRVTGTVQLYPGTEPERLLDRATEMFIPVTDATAYRGDRRVTGEGTSTVLINRHYLRGVQQIDKRTGVAHQPAPGTRPPAEEPAE